MEKGVGKFERKGEKEKRKIRGRKGDINAKKRW
jgi:hypothetical protein